jgi:hypothetical protein
LSWRRLRILIEALIATPGTMLQRRLAGDDWTLDQHLMALAVDRLTVANWQRSKSGQKGTNRPKPVSPLAKRGRQHDRTGRTDQDPAAVKALLDRYRRGEVSGGG